MQSRAASHENQTIIIRWQAVLFLGAFLAAMAFMIGYATAAETVTAEPAKTITIEWVDEDGNLTDKGEQAMAALALAPRHGLSPSRYAINQTPDNQQITQAMVRLAQDLKTGVKPDARYDRLNISETRPDAQILLQQMADADDVKQWMKLQAPATPVYKRLAKTLKTFRGMEKNQSWPQLAAGASLKPGMTDPRVATLRQMLELTGDLKAPFENAAPNHYDTVLADAVKRFQSRHGLNADAAVGPATRAALNVPLAKRMDAIRVTMERIRQLPDHLGEKFILVNLPAFQLTAFDHGKEAINMKVIVGRADRKTPLFSNAITQAVFNPTWSVPTKIAREDFPKKLQANPDYLSQHGFTVMQDGMRVDPSYVDWQSVGSYSLQQASGNGNALGKVKFPIPDNQSVYLHDTSDRSLFSKDMRALSSGCIRVEAPRELASFIVNGNAGWDEATIAAAYDSRSNRTVNITPVPVHAVYWTAWVDPDGTTHFYDDIYRNDPVTLAALGDDDDKDLMQLAAR